MAARSERALGLLLRTVLDAVFADPRRGHPVAVFGAVASPVEDRFWAGTRARGLLFTSLTALALSGVVAHIAPVIHDGRLA
jgi:adenosylcobinamide-phosphate synthase